MSGPGPDGRATGGAGQPGGGVAESVEAATSSGSAAAGRTPVAAVGEVSLPRLWPAVPALSTVSELWLRLLEALGRDSAALGPERCA